MLLPPFVKSKLKHPPPKRRHSIESLQSLAPLPHPEEKRQTTFSPTSYPQPKRRHSIDSLQSPAPLPHPDKKRQTASYPRPIPPLPSPLCQCPICVNSKPKRPLRIPNDSLQSPTPLPHPDEKKQTASYPRPIPPRPPLCKCPRCVNSKPKCHLPNDSLQSPAPIPHPDEKRQTASYPQPIQPRPSPLCPICFPFVKSKPKCPLSIDSLLSPAPLPHPGDAFSPMSNTLPPPPSYNDACSLTFHSDSEYDLYDDVPGHLPMVPKDQSASPKLGRSNNMTCTKKLIASSKWNCRWRFWKKNEEKESSEKSQDAGASDNTTSGNMFSVNGNSCFMGGSYYHVRGNAQFSPFQVSLGAISDLLLFKILT